MSIRPSVSRQISSAVVRRWISGLAGFLNCWGMKALGVFLSNSSAFRTAPGIPSRRRGQHDLGPEGLDQPPPLQAHALGHGDHQAIPLAAQVNASAIPVLPLVGSMITVSLLIRPSASAA